jgi:hypothetical protein
LSIPRCKSPPETFAQDPSQLLESLAAPLRKRGIEVTTEVVGAIGKSHAMTRHHQQWHREQHEEVFKKPVLSVDRVDGEYQPDRNE